MTRTLLAVAALVLVGCSPKSSLMTLSDEPAGANCAHGGAKLEAGLDANGNGALDASEVTSTSYVCGGADGATGMNGTSCTVADTGGTKIISCGAGTQVTISDGAKGDTGAPGSTGAPGADGASCATTDNGNGTVTFTCGQTSVTVTLGSGNGANGHNSLVAMTADTSGTCPAGGTQVQSGLDLNDNDVLDGSEIASTQYVCNGTNGTNGTNGADGHNSLVSLTADSTTCAAGGTRIQAGVDSNDNGTLDTNEVVDTRYVCNGAAGTNGTNGRNSLITMSNEPAGTNCPAGGKRLQVGVDTNGNGALDAAEISGTQYVCNGAAAANSIYGNGQDGALTIAAGGANWVTSPPTGTLQFTTITVNGQWTLPPGMKLRATGTITLAAGGSIVVPPSTASGLGIASSPPQALLNNAGAMYGGTGCSAAVARQLFNPGRFGGGTGNGANGASITLGGGGGTVVLLAGGAISLASGTSISAVGGAGLVGSASANSGGGGGGGVVVLLSNTSITNAGAINVSGGAGANVITTPDSSAGGGGGGGLIQLAAPSVTNTGTLNVNGGAAGSGSSQGGYAGGGGASVGNGGGSGGAGVPTASPGTAGLALLTVTTDPAALFLTSSRP